MRGLGVLLAASACAGLTGCFDDSIQSSFAPAADASSDGTDAPTTGGDGACPILTSTLDVFVKDVQNGLDVCDATVVASAGAASLTLQPQGSPTACSYSAGLPPPQPGTYTILVTAPGYAPATQTGVVITTDSCGNTDAPTVTIQIGPQPVDAGADQGASDAAAGPG